MRYLRLTVVVSILLLCGLIVGSTDSAEAATFSFQYHGEGVSSSGTLYGTYNHDSSFSITGIMGQRNGVSILYMEAAAPGAGYGYSAEGFGPHFDNRLFLGMTGRLDSAGLRFAVPDIQFENLYFANGQYYERPEMNLTGRTSTPVELSIISSPEPGSLGLLALGMGTLWLTSKKVKSPI